MLVALLKSRAVPRAGMDAFGLSHTETEAPVKSTDIELGTVYETEELAAATRLGPPYGPPVVVYVKVPVPTGLVRLPFVSARELLNGIRAHD